jgi:hypothetical protein
MKYPLTRKGVLVLVILITLFTAADLIMTSFRIHENREGVFWGIIGIQFTVGVGVLLFLMQMKSDSYINEIIQKQNTRYTRSKSYLCNDIIGKLREFQKAYIDLLPYIRNFESNKADPDFLKRLQSSVLMKDFAIKNNYIPIILKDVNLIIDKLDEVELGLRIQGYLDSLYGAIMTMAESHKIKNDPYCGLTVILPIKYEIELVEENIKELQELIDGMEKEKPGEK